MKYNYGESPYVLLSFPRAGSHYLQNLLLARFGIVADRFHWFYQVKNKDVFVISIIRNPIDSIASAMSNNVNAGRTPGSIEDHFGSYIDSMEEIMQHSDIIIDFEELVSNTNATAIKISDAIGVRLFDNGYDISVEEEPGSEFIVSSKGVPGYEDLRKAIANSPYLSSVMDKHNALLDRCI